MADKNKQKAVIADVAKPHDLKEAHTHDGAAENLDRIKTLGAVKKGVELDHVDKPKDGLTDAQKKAFVEDKKDKGKPAAAAAPKKK